MCRSCCKWTQMQKTYSQINIRFGIYMKRSTSELGLRCSNSKAICNQSNLVPVLKEISACTILKWMNQIGIKSWSQFSVSKSELHSFASYSKNCLVYMAFIVSACVRIRGNVQTSYKGILTYWANLDLIISFRLLQTWMAWHLQALLFIQRRWPGNVRGSEKKVCCKECRACQSSLHQSFLRVFHSTSVSILSFYVHWWREGSVIHSLFFHVFMFYRKLICSCTRQWTWPCN